MKEIRITNPEHSRSTGKPLQGCTCLGHYCINNGWTKIGREEGPCILSNAASFSIAALSFLYKWGRPLFLSLFLSFLPSTTHFDMSQRQPHPIAYNGFEKGSSIYGKANTNDGSFWPSSCYGTNGNMMPFRRIKTAVPFGSHRVYPDYYSCQC